MTGPKTGGRSHSAVVQELAISAEEEGDFKRERKVPQLSLICSTLTHGKVRFVFQNAGVFNTYFQPSGLETSSVNLRWESQDGIATSFIETVWDKVHPRAHAGLRNATVGTEH
jgi:hypothetical protein